MVDTIKLWFYNPQQLGEETIWSYLGTTHIHLYLPQTINKERIASLMVKALDTAKKRIDFKRYR